MLSWKSIALMVFALIPAAGCYAADELPNVLLIMTDDVGYGDLGCYGASGIATPNLDKLAAEGLRFTAGYTSASTCTPTRYSLLTGQYAFRQPGTGIAPPNATALITPDRHTLAKMMKAAGYRTGIVGKWHLGLGSPPRPQWNGDLKPGPLEIGFDYCFLMPTTGDRVPCVYVENHGVIGLDPHDPITVAKRNPDGQPTGRTHRGKLKMDWTHGHNHSIVNGISRIGFMTGGLTARWTDETMADVFTGKAIQFIERNKDQRFFLFFSTHDIHVPRMPHWRFQDSSQRGYRGDAVQQMDWCVGELVKKLEKLGLRDNTLIVFCSDNGPVLDDGYKDQAVEKLGDHKPAGPWRGGKYSVYEGGTRTPFITHWPGPIQPGVSDKIVSTIDLYASLAAMTGQELPQDAAPDSFNVLPALLGRDGAQGRGHIIQQDNRNKRGFRHGDWKLVLHGKKPELYNLADDPAETKNLTKQHPDRVAQMKAMLGKIKTSGRSRDVDLK